MSVIGHFIGLGIYRFFRWKWLSRITTILAVVLLIFMTIHSGFTDGFVLMLLFYAIVTLPIFLILGIIEAIRTMPKRRRNAQYEKLFENMNFKSISGDYPHFINEEDTTYIKTLSFRSQIPLKEWQSKKALFETNFNAKIIKICNAENDYNITKILIVNNELPTSIEWEHYTHISYDKDILTLGICYENYIRMDLNDNAHAFIAGETGSGKSVLLKGLIYQSLFLDHEVILIDFKRGVSFAKFEEFITIYSEHEIIIEVLENLVTTTNNRFDLFKHNKVENIKEYNEKCPKGKELKRIVVYIDELAELIKTGDKETTARITGSLETLTRISRAAGVHLIMGIQRPDSTVINGQIKSNVSYRVCGRFVDPEPSRIMLGNDRATQLANIKGRFILKDVDYTEFQAFLFLDLDMDRIKIMQEKRRKENPNYKEAQPDYMLVNAKPVLNIEEVKQEIPKQETKQEIEFNFDDIDFQ